MPTGRGATGRPPASFERVLPSSWAPRAPTTPDVTDDITGHRRSADDVAPAGSPAVAWLLALTAVVHAVLAVAGLLPGGPGAATAAADAVLAAVLIVAVLVAVLPPTPIATPVVQSYGTAVAVVAAGAVSGLRAATSGEPFAGGDVVLAVLVAVTLPSTGLFLAAAGGAELAWLVAQLVGLGTGSLRPTGVQWVMLVVLALAPAVAAAMLRHGHQQLAVELAEARRTAGQQAVTDALTGVTNRRGLELMALPMIEHARRQGEAAHCLFIDLDGFRTVNESLGRESGDEVLTSVCEAVLASVRATDVVARWAGDQFVVVGPGTGTSPLEMERRVRGHLVEFPPVPPEVWDGRVSIGSATLVPWDEGNVDSLLRRAEEDMQLRRSLRRQSRSRSVGVPPPPPDPAPTVERRTPKPHPPLT